MTLREQLEKLPDDETVYLALEELPGFIVIKPCKWLRRHLIGQNGKFHRAVKKCLSGSQAKLELLPLKIEQTQTELDALRTEPEPDDKKAAEKLERAINRKKSLLMYYGAEQRRLTTLVGRAKGILQNWIPFEKRTVLECYSRLEVCGGGTVVTVPGDVVGIATGYWFPEEQGAVTTAQARKTAAGSTSSDSGKEK